jgi:hypothetical protein
MAGDSDTNRNRPFGVCLCCIFLYIPLEPAAGRCQGYHRYRPVRLRRIHALSQFGVGFGVSQFTIAGYALAQFAVAYSLIVQMRIYIHEGHGQIVKSVDELMKLIGG